MLITCNNKGCLQQSDAKLDQKTNEVLCANCGKSISNVTEIMKKTLKGAGQVIRHTEKKAFMMDCVKCGAKREVIFDENENTSCKICKSPVKVHAAMKQAMKQFAVKDEEDFDDDSTEAEEVKKVVKKKATRRKNEEE